MVEVVVGVAPHKALGYDLQAELKFIRAHSSEIAGIGEIGLDLRHFSQQTLPAQEKAFVAQLELAEELGLPVVVHSRKAEERVLQVLAGFTKVKAVLHFFLSPKLASKASALACLLSLPTIKSSSKQKIAKQVGLQQLACETDSPFGLSKGLTSEPKDVVSAYEEISQAKRMRVEEASEKNLLECKTLFWNRGLRVVA